MSQGGVFKDYFSRHSDLRWHENRFLGLTSAWKLVFVPAQVRMPTKINFKNPPPAFSRLTLLMHIFNLGENPLGQEQLPKLGAGTPAKIGSAPELTYVKKLSQSVSQSISQSINQSIDQSVSQSVSQSIVQGLFGPKLIILTN